MKQFPMKLVHKSLTPLLLAVAALFAPCQPLAAAPEGKPPPYLEYFDPAKGFKPGQRNLTKIFMQLAGSLEHYGSPEPYIRYVMAVHKQQGGKDCPDYLTDEYVEDIIARWNRLSKNLMLDAIARNAGRNMRLAIQGTWNMPVWEGVAQETALSPKEAAMFRKFLEKPYFKKSDFKELEVFYSDGGAYDKLSPSGKAAISLRVKRGQMTPDQRDTSIRDKGGSLAIKILNTYQDKLGEYLSGKSKEVVNTDNLIAMLKEGLKLDEDSPNLSGMTDYTYDAIFYSHLIRSEFIAIFNHLRRAETKERAEGFTELIKSKFIRDIAIIANSEFKANLPESDSE